MASRPCRTVASTCFSFRPTFTDLQCCNALAEIKGLAATASTRVILLTRGGGVERARGLDLGADDVLSPQWESAELLARVRVQLRDKRVYEDLREKTRTRDRRAGDCANRVSSGGRNRENDARCHQAGSRAENRRRFAYFRGRDYCRNFPAVFATRGQGDETRLFGDCATGTWRSQARRTVAETRKMRADLQETDAALQKEELQKQTEDLRQKISSGEAGDVSGLKKQLEETTGRLKRVMSESDAAEGVIRSYAPSVCLLHVSVGFNDKSSGRRLRYAGLIRMAGR